MSHGKDMNKWVCLCLWDALPRLRYHDDTLTHLDLQYNKLGARGARAMADALKGNNTLRNLNLRGNRIGIEGAREMADVLKGNTTLIDLNYWQWGSSCISRYLEGEHHPHKPGFDE